MLLPFEFIPHPSSLTLLNHQLIFLIQLLLSLFSPHLLATTTSSSLFQPFGLPSTACFIQNYYSTFKIVQENFPETESLFLTFVLIQIAVILGVLFAVSLQAVTLMIEDLP